MDLAELQRTLTSPDFDVEKHASQLIQSGQDIGQYMQDLAAAEQEVDQMLQEQVSSHYEDLISQATGVEQLEAHLEMMQTHMATLVAATDRLRAKIRDPHKSIRNQTLTLSRLQETCDLLRRMIRTLQLGKKLQAQLQSGPQEMTKAAISINELSELWVPELSNIDLIEQDQRVILHARTDVERNADGMMSRGMESQNQNHIGIAIQVFQNLSMLQGKLDKAVESHLVKVKAKFANSLDVKKITNASEDRASSSSGPSTGPGRAAMPAPGNMASFRATLWTNLEGLLDMVFNQTCEIICLQRVLCKKKDAVTHTSFIELLPGSKGKVLKNYWSQLIDVFTTKLLEATRESNFLKQALEGEYPKLLRLYNDLWSRLHQAGSDLKIEDSSFDLENPLASQSMDDSLRDTLSDLERAYLSRSLSRLFDPVNLMFSSGEVPTESELHHVFKGISSELNVSMVDTRLCHTVGKNVAKTVRLMCVKCEHILVTDGEASQVVGYPTEGQRRNVAIVNCLSMFKSGIEEIVSDGGLVPETAQVVKESLADIDKQVCNAINPLLSSIKDAVEAIILTVHKEDFSAAESTEDKTCSLYMKELQGFISRVAVDFLQEFICQDFLTECVLPVVAHCIDQFILHASLVRPLGKGGQFKLASDCAQLELALDPLVKDRVSNQMSLEASYATLRAFRSLLFMQPADVPCCESLGKTLPVSIALHFLFSTAPPELKSPHDSAGWSVSRYSQWLDDHKSEKERLQLMQGTLESYVAGTRARQEKSYAFPYPIMLQILEKFN